MTPLTERDRVNVQAVLTMLQLARSTERESLRRAIWQDIAIHLARLREHHTGAEWETIVRWECGLAKTRAYQIMALVRKKSAKESKGAAEKRQQNQAGAKPR